MVGVLRKIAWGRLVEALLVAVIASGLVSYGAYRLLRENVSSIISRGLDILSVDETIALLDEIAEPRQSPQPGEGPVESSGLLDALAALQQDLSALDDALDAYAASMKKLIDDLEGLHVSDIPGRFRGELVSNPKNAFRDRLIEAGTNCRGLRVRVSQALGTLAVLREHSGDLEAKAGEAWRLRYERVRRTASEARVALASRREAMMRVLAEFQVDN